jgi:hypothetical protein
MSSRIALLLLFILAGINAWAQSGNSTSISGTVVDPSGAVVEGATVQVENPVSQFVRSTTTDSAGKFTVPNVPFNPYHLTVRGKGFAPHAQDVEVRSTVPLNLKISLAVESAGTTINVESSGEDLTENTPVSHTDVDRGLFDKLPLESASSSVSSLVTLATPGIAADSNGLFHGLGDHAENSFSIDGQPITDQQSKVFSNQIPLDSVESMEVIGGAPPAEFGDKTSVVIKVTTRSGQGVTTPHGALTTSYGSFGTVNTSFNLAYGGQKWGNFIAANGLNSGRFLDPPEFAAIHDRGNEENIFDRVDFQVSNLDTLHLNANFTRSWFENPNAYDNLHVGQTDPIGNLLGPTDQRSQIKTFNFAPSWTHLLGSNAVFTLGGYVRRDQYNYYPSGDAFADIGPIQQETVSQSRSLTNAGLRSDISYAKGVHNIKAGFVYEQTLLNENDNFGIVDPTLLSSLTGASGGSCLDSSGNPIAAPCTDLAPFDLTRGGKLYRFNGHTDVKELALYIQDAITKGNWNFNLGIRGDLYNGLTMAHQAEPRVGISYHVAPSNTVLRVSYARLLETPFNENLVLASTGCNYTVIADLIPCVPAVNTPGYRNEFHAGLEQAFGKYLVVSGDYIWKYTHSGYDFSIFAATPIFFPIGWHNSKINGFDMRVSVPNYHGLTALVVMSSVAARFFPPQTSGLGVTVGQSGLPFRIDHDEKFNATTHVQYQTPWKKFSPWIGFNWRYDSGLVAGAVPFATDTTTPVDLTGLTADQQMQAGLFCGSQRPTLSAPLTTCVPAQYGSTLISIPAPGTENDDHNPPRIAPRSLFDLAVGDDNLFRGDRYKWSLRLSAINLTNKVALYNFLSTFSGTHYVTPRALTAELGFHF